MSNYNMADRFNSNLKLNYSELYKDFGYFSEDADSQNQFYKELHNNKGTGIIDRLKSKLNFDIQALGRFNSQQRYDELRLLKLLYMIEKTGYKITKSGGLDEEKIPKHKFIPVLENPYYNNINTSFDNKERANNAHYGDDIDYLINQLKIGIGVEEANDLEEKYVKIDIEWTQVVCKMFYKWKMSDPAQYKEKLCELKSIEKYIQESIIDKLEPYMNPEFQCDYGVLKSFFNLLMCHRNLCYEADLIRNRYSILEKDVDEKYSRNFTFISQLGDMQMEGTDISDKIKELGLQFNLPISVRLDEAIDFLENGFSDNPTPVGDFIWGMITYGRGVPFKERTLNKYIDRFKQVYRFLTVYRSDEYRGMAHEMYHRNTEDNPIIFLADIIVIMQEIIYGDTTEEVQSKYFRVGSSYKKSLASLFGSKENYDPVVVQAWVNQLENRNAINLGKREMIELKRRIDTLLFRLKEIMYSNRTLEDVDLVMHLFCSELGIRLANEAQMEAHRNFMESVVKLIPDLSCINEIVFPVEDNNALRYLTMLASQNKCDLDPFFQFWVKLSFFLPYHHYNTYEASCNLKQLGQEALEDFCSRYYDVLNKTEKENINNGDITFGFNGGIIWDGIRIEVTAPTFGFHKAYVFICNYRPQNGILSIVDCKPAIDADDKVRLDELGFNELLHNYLTN